MAQPLRAEDFFPPFEEVQRAPTPHDPDLTTPAGVRRFLQSEREAVAKIEAKSQHFAKGGQLLVAKAEAEAVSAQMIEPVIPELEQMEEVFRDGVRSLESHARSLIRLAKKANLRELRAATTELSHREVKAYGVLLRALRDTRWQLMVVLEKKRPSDAAITIRSAADLAQLFDDEPSGD